MNPHDPQVLLAGVEPCSLVDGPGARFVAFFQGCTFDCVACHNPATIPRRRVGEARWVTLGSLMDQVREQVPFLSGVTASGGECTAQLPFLRTWFAALKADPALAHLTTLVDTNGDALGASWTSLRDVMDGAMVDLKAFDDGTHRLLTGSSNRSVLASIRTLAGLGKLAEVRLLVLPGLNDGEEHLRATAAWLLSVDPAVRVVLIGFRHDGTRGLARYLPPASAADVDRAAGVLRSEGLAAVLAAGTPTRGS